MFSSFGVFFDNGSEYSSIDLWFPVLTGQKAQGWRNQGKGVEEHRIQARHFQYRARIVYCLHCKVGVQKIIVGLFSHTWAPFSHQAVADIEIEFLLRNFTEKNPKLLMEHIQKMASGEAPFFSATLSLVYDKLVERVLTQPISPGKPTEAGNKSAAEPTSTTQASSPMFSFVNSAATPTVPLPPQSPAPVPHAPVWLVCFQCGDQARMQDLPEGTRCPRCPSRSPQKGKPFMQCPLCRLVRAARHPTCVRAVCQVRFM